MTLNWIGLESEEFAPYRLWKNNGKVGICGTYTAAALVHYIAKRDTGIALDKNVLIEGFRKPVDTLNFHKGSYYWNIREALNYMLAHANYVAKSGWFAERKVPQIIREAQMPVIVGTLKYLGSSYKNHWLLIYAYAYDAQGHLYFKGYDNHGNHEAIISATETFSYVYLEDYSLSHAENKTITVLTDTPTSGIKIGSNPQK